jgi:hypothetical protein
LHITWVVVFTANPSTFVELPPFYMSEWLRAFNFAVSCYFLVLFKEVKETVTKSGAKHHNIKYCVGKEHYVVLVIHTFVIYIYV